MMCRILWVVVLCLCVTPAFCQNATSAVRANSGTPTDSDTLRQIEADHLHSEMTTDSSVYERVLADDYVNLNPRGLGPGNQDS